jgi:cobalt-zinc-cadmium efflux system protein
VEHKHDHQLIDGSTSTARLFITMMLNFLITVVEFIGGVFSGSLSLISDALHNFSDGIAIIISYIAIRLGRHPQSFKYTFGLKRAEILAAAFNAGTLIGICIYLFKESYERFVSPQHIQGSMMILVATIGLVANVVGTILLKKGSKNNINIRSTYFHLLGDAVSSLAVIIGGLFIHLFRMYWVDPLLTILISLYILKKSIEIVLESINVLMMGAPENVSIENIQREMEEIPGINNIHHVHVWRLGEHDIHFEAHIDVDDMLVSRTTSLSSVVEEKLKNNHRITHITLQFETDRCNSKSLLANKK